jgi:hypothetical protein
VPRIDRERVGPRTTQPAELALRKILAGVQKPVLHPAKIFRRPNSPVLMVDT